MDIDIVYQQTLDYLYSYVDYSLTRGFRSPENFDLKRLHKFLDILDNPHKGYPVIHIAGTKGKGSVAAFCSSALIAAGYRVGLYTSPHLQDYTERIQLNNQPIPRQELVRLVEEIKPYLDRGTELTTFEITTALAFLYFARQEASVVVAEVGLGGRLDATNVVTPLVSVITSISYDHTDVLGETLEEIAGEKAAIIKPGAPVVVAPQRDEVRKIIEQAAKDQGAPLIMVGQDYAFVPLAHTLDGQSLEVWATSELPMMIGTNDVDELQEQEPVQLSIPMLGYHQVENAATAYATMQVVSTRGLPLKDVDIQRGFLEIDWPGRFEILQRNPPVVIDAAHNRDSAKKLRLTLDEYFPDRLVVLVFGASEDKDVKGMFAELAPRVWKIILTRSYHPRAMAQEVMMDASRQYDPSVSYIPDVKIALMEAERLVDDTGMILVTGSIFVAAEARDAWYNRLSVLGEE